MQKVWRDDHGFHINMLVRCPSGAVEWIWVWMSTLEVAEWPDRIRSDMSPLESTKGPN